MELDPKNLTEDQQRQLLFFTLVQQHEQLAMMGLGKLKNPSNDSIERDLTQARYMIDTLEMLQQYTKGNLQDELASYLQHVLNTLRLNYADESKKG
jgi:hypothetical protein